MGIGRKVALNSLTQIVGKGVTTTLSLVLVALITRAAGVSGYGEYVTVLAYTQFFALFADLGVNLYLIQRLSGIEEGTDEQVEAMLSLRIVTSLLVMTIAAVLSLFLPYTGAVKTGILIGLVAVGLQSLNSLFVSILQARLHMVPAVVGDVVGRAVVLLGTWIAILRGASLLEIIAALLIGAVVNVGITLFASGRYVSVKLVWQPVVWQRILRFSLPISATAILSYIYFKTDAVLLSVLPIPGKDNTVEVGIYGSAYKVVELLLLVPSIVIGNIFPIISSFLARNDSRLPVLLQRSFDGMALVAFPVTAVVAVLAPQIIEFIAGPEFSAAATPLRILALTVFFSYFAGIYTYTTLALGKQRELVLVYTIAAVFNVSVNLITIPIFSYYAAAVTTFLTECIVLVGVYRLCYRHLHVPLHAAILYRLIPITSCFAGVLYLLRDYSLLGVLLVSAVLYTVLILMAGLVRIRDLIRLLSRA